MSQGLLAKKIGMTSIFDEAGKIIPVTVLKSGNNKVMQLRLKERDGYNAVQLAFGEVKKSSLNKAEKGHQKAEEKNYILLREFRDFEGCVLGQVIGVDILKVGTKVRISGVSKGKGFQGGIKRYGFGGGRATHGSGHHRAPGSQNASAYPSRVFKGKRLPGHKGARWTSVGNLKIAAIDSNNGLIFIKGAVPGPRTTFVKIEVQK